MADNTSQDGTDVLRSKDRSGVKTQVMGVDINVGGTETLLSATNPMPSYNPEGYVTGNITAANSNLNSGTATANSSVQITVPQGHSSWDVYVSGTFSATTTLYLQGSLDGTNWFSMSARRNTDPAATDMTYISSSSLVGGAFPTGSNPSNWRGTLGAVRYLRVTCAAYTASDNIAIQISTSSGVGAVFLNTGLPSSLNSIGGVHGGSLGSVSGTVAAGATGTVGPLEVSIQGNVTFTVKSTVPASPWAGAPVIVFEQSDDNTSWGALTVVRSDNQQVSSTHTLPAGVANGEIIFDAPAEAISYVRARVTTGPTTNGITIKITSGGMPFMPVVTAIDRKDAARVNVSATYISTSPVVADTLLTLQLIKGSAAATGVTTIPVTSGKVLRITGITVGLRATAATLPYGVASLRVNYSGAAVIGSPLVGYFNVSGSAAVVGNTGTSIFSYPDGLIDLSGSAQFGISFSNNVNTNVAHITVMGYEYVASA